LFTFCSRFKIAVWLLREQYIDSIRLAHSRSFAYPSTQFFKSFRLVSNAPKLHLGGYVRSAQCSYVGRINFLYCFAQILTSLCGCAKPCASDISPLYTLSFHPNLTVLHSVLSSHLTSAHPSRLGSAHPKSCECRERQLLARRIPGSQNGLHGGRDSPWYRDGRPDSTSWY
jgi:hypothetical protein